MIKEKFSCEPMIQMIKLNLKKLLVKKKEDG